MTTRIISLYHVLLILAAFFPIVTQAQDAEAYKIFTREGRETSYSRMIKAAAEADVVLFGELHNNALNHWLELQVLQDLFKSRNNLILGMEMFEADNQLVLNEYLQGLIEERHLLQEAKVWDNYKTDYKPLVDFAKANNLPVVATNIPRRYANLVYRKGMTALDGLPVEARQWIVPLPVEIDLTVACYKNMMGGGTHTGAPAGNLENMARSQALKDATMAYNILRNLGRPVLHVHGAYHSQNFEGIMWYLRKARPELKIVTIHTVEQASVGKLEQTNEGSADFIICLPKDMTKTF